MTALAIRGPFTAQDAHRAGVSARQLSGRRYRQLFRGVYVDSSVLVTTRVRAAAALVLSPKGSYLSHHVAAELLGGVVPAQASIDVSTTGFRSARAGLASHRARLDADIIDVDGLPVTSPTSTFIDLARAGLPLVHLVVLGDSLVSAGRARPEELVLAAGRMTGRGAGRAKAAAALVRAGVHSAMESRFRLLVVLAGLPEPETNVVIRDESGTVVRRLDLGYRAARLGLEYDGQQHRTDDRQWAGDLVRREDLEHEGWRLVVATGRDIYRTPARTIDRVVRAMLDQGMVVPTRRSEDWRLHFPTTERVRRQP